MITYALILLALNLASLIATGYLQQKGFLQGLIGFGLTLPLIGRVLAWW